MFSGLTGGFAGNSEHWVTTDTGKTWLNKKAQFSFAPEEELQFNKEKSKFVLARSETEVTPFPIPFPFLPPCTMHT